MHVTWTLIADGGVDVLISSNGKSPTIYSNRFSNSNHYLQIDLEGPAVNHKERRQPRSVNI